MSTNRAVEPAADLILLRRAKDRIDREFAQPLEGRLQPTFDVGRLTRRFTVERRRLGEEFRRRFGPQFGRIS